MFFKNKYKKSDDEKLMQWIRLGDAKAFDTLYERYSQRMLHYFYRMLGKNEEKAQDFLQDLFLKVVEKPHLFDESRRFSTWIFTLASNMCKNEYRRLEVRRNGSAYIGDFNATSEDIVLPHIDKQMDCDAFKTLLYEELAQMNDTKQTTFLLRYQEHFSIKEISEVMNCSEGTVKSRLFYITKCLAEKLEVYNPSYQH
ncbi:MAG: sigma-70 family RNA polymerase sigma factor [Chitinophagales bacterium]